MREIALIMAALLDRHEALIRENPAMIRCEELADLSGDSSKARVKIGWSASPLLGGLTRLVEQMDRQTFETA